MPTMRRRRFGPRLLLLGRADDGGDVDALARPHARLARPAAARAVARRSGRGLGVEPVAADRVAECPLHQSLLSRLGRDQRAAVALPGQGPPHQPVDREDEHDARDADDDEERQEVDLHHLLLSEDRAEHGEQHVRCDAPRERGHRLEPGRPGVDRRRQRRRWRSRAGTRPGPTARRAWGAPGRRPARPRTPRWRPSRARRAERRVMGSSHSRSGWAPCDAERNDHRLLHHQHDEDHQCHPRPWSGRSCRRHPLHDVDVGQLAEVGRRVDRDASPGSPPRRCGRT